MKQPLEPERRGGSLGSFFLRLGADGLRSRAWRIAAGYALFASLWIYFSDQTLEQLVPDPERRVRWSVYKGIAFVAVTTGLLLLFMRRAFGAIEAGYALYKDQAAQRRDSEEHLAAVVRTAMDAIVVVDAAGHIVLFNAAAERMFGCTAGQAAARALGDFLPGDSVLSGEGRRVFRGRRADGREFPLEASVSLVEGGDRPRRTIILRDISERQAHEEEIERLRRLYAALSHINQAIVWTPARDGLFRKVCQALVEHGGFRVAWIGWHDPAARRIRPVGVAGDENDFIKNIVVSTEDVPEGHGPPGEAFRTGRPYICNDMRADPALAPWRAQMERRGLRACAAFPIRERGTVVGILNVNADEPGFFQDKEIALLMGSAADVSFALDNLTRETERQQAEATVRTERLFSDTMIESMPGILYFYDTRGKFLRWNRNFELVSGYTAEEIAGMHPLNFFSAAEKARVEQRISEVFVRGESSVEADFVAKDGQATPYFFTGRRVAFEGRDCLVGVGIDISERRRAEAALRAAQERFEVVVENMTEGLVIASPDTSLLHWNPASLRILGFADLEEGRRRQREFADIFELSRLDGTPIPREQWPLARVRRGEEFEEFEVRVSRPGTGWTRLISYTGTRVGLTDGRILAFMLLVDVTERKRSEQLLRDAKAHLEHEVAERTGELQAALVRAEAADRIKSAFLATMSHELRTPLNSIIGFTGIVLQGLAGPLNAEQAKQLGMVRGSARHLLDLINDVLDISKIEAGQLEVRATPFDLPELIGRVVASVRPMAEKKGLALTAVLAPELGEMLSDRRRVEQILLNLLNNALKFTERGDVTLTASLITEGRPGPDGALRPAVRIVVSDTGIGIRPADLATLFQPFRQIDTGLSRQHEGTGLGLAICRRLATLLEGEITAASVWSRGSEFTLIIPVELTPAP